MNEKKKSESSTQTFAYTPGLKVKRYTEIDKERKLPLNGEVLVEEGDEISYDKIVARAYTKGDPNVLDAASILQVEPKQINYYLVKKIDEVVQEGEIIANFKAFFGLINRSVVSPIEGTIETISLETGQIIIRGKPIPIELNAYIPGKIIKVVPNEGVVVRTNGALIQGVFGISGETHGELKIIEDTYDKSISEDNISNNYKGKVLVGYSDVTLEALKKSVSVGVAGIIIGGINEEILDDFIGEEIGVAITGLEHTGLTLIITEGFGKINMSKRTFNLLKEYEGYKVSMNGSTQIRAGVIRPEIIIPYDRNTKQGASSDTDSSKNVPDGMLQGTRVRIIREPYFGLIGTVQSLPIELQQVESGSLVRVMTIKLEDNKEVIIPRANVEILEE